MKNVFTLQTFTLREIAEAEGEEYQTILNRKKRGEYVAVAFLSGGANARVSYRYLSKRTSELLRVFNEQKVFDVAIVEDEKNAIMAKKRRAVRASFSLPHKFS